MRIIYSTEKIKKICEDIKIATRHFGGNKMLAISLMSRINSLKQADNIKDIINQPQMSFHKLLNKGKNKNLEGYFAIDVKTRKDKWRIIIELLDDDKNPFVPCNIDVIANYVKVVEVKEVSKHYE